MEGLNLFYMQNNRPGHIKYIPVYIYFLVVRLATQMSQLTYIKYSTALKYKCAIGFTPVLLTICDYIYFPYVTYLYILYFKKMS